MTISFAAVTQISVSIDKLCLLLMIKLIFLKFSKKKAVFLTRSLKARRLVKTDVKINRAEKKRGVPFTGQKIKDKNRGFCFQQSLSELEKETFHAMAAAPEDESKSVIKSLIDGLELLNVN